MRYKRTINLKRLCVFVIVALSMQMALTGCNENIEERMENYPDQTNPDYHKGKVLWVIIDGASGTAVKQANNNRRTNNLREMLQHSIYTFDGLAELGDTVLDNSKGWKNLMTGTSDASVQREETSVLKHVKDLGRSTALYASDNDFYNLFSSDADTKYLDVDGQTTAKLVSSLGAEEVPDFTVIEYNGVRKAGEEHGYFDEANQYATNEVLDAISKVDGYVGTLLEALRKRPQYEAERWLVVVTSNYGGLMDNTGQTNYDKKDRNVFSMIYNDRFSAKLLQRPSSSDAMLYSYFTPAYSGTGKTESAVVNDPTLFDFKFDKEETDTNKITNYTVQFMFYCQQNYSGHTFLSKALRASPGSDEGWIIQGESNRFMSILAGSKQWSAQKSTSNIRDKKWHVLTFVFDFRKRIFAMFKDGALETYGYKKHTVDRNLSTDSLAALTIGKIFGSKTAKCEFYITNLQIYNVALPDDFIAKNYSQTYIDELGPKYKYWDNLIGYWPCDREDDYMKKVLYDYSKYGTIFGGENAGRSDMKLKNATWISGSSAEDNVAPHIDATYYQKVLQTVDLAYQSFQWLGLQIDSSWLWEGIARPLPYNND